MNLLGWLLAAAIVYLAVSLVAAARRPAGRVYPTRRDGLLRRRGPLAVGALEGVTVRGVTGSGGEARVLLAATYAYEVKGNRYRLSLPLHSERLGGPRVRFARRTRVRTHWLPEAITLDDGRELESLDAIAGYYHDLVRQGHAQVQVLYSSRQPAVSTVRDWL